MMNSAGVQRCWSRLVSAVVLGLVVAVPAGAGQAPPPVVMKRVAPDLYLHLDGTASNSIIWVTGEGVLVVDTKQHPRQAQALVREIRNITDKPIRWAFVTQAHGDHYLGNQVFKELGATIVSHNDVARLMEKYLDKEMASRQRFFASNNFDPKEIRLTLPEVTFETKMTIHLGGKVAHLIYLGPVQDPGNAFVHFPHAKALATGGGFAAQFWSNPEKTPSVDGWIAVLRQVKAMDVDAYLPGHGDVGTKQDVEDQVGFLTDFQAVVKDAIARGLSKEAMISAPPLTKYKDWRNSHLAAQHLEALRHLLTTGKPIYLDRE